MSHVRLKIQLSHMCVTVILTLIVTNASSLVGAQIGLQYILLFARLYFRSSQTILLAMLLKLFFFLPSSWAHESALFSIQLM